MPKSEPDAGRTLSLCGCIAAEHLGILCNPAVAWPGLQLVTSANLRGFRRSGCYGETANAVLARSAFVIEPC